MGVSYKNAFDHMMPEEVCPICGKTFIRRCHRDEWGYWANTGNGLMLFCSSACTKEYEERKFMGRVQEVLNSKAYAAYMFTKKGMSNRDAIRAAGLRSDNAIQNLKLHRWRELEYLEEHGWTA